MPDDITLNPGAGGSVLATDEIAGRHFELVKITLGLDGANDGPVAEDNPLPVREVTDDAIRSTVNAAAADTLLLAQSTARRGAIFVNESNATLKIGLGAAPVTATDYSLAIGPGGYWQLPYGFRGMIRGLWDGTAGAVRITEIE